MADDTQSPSFMGGLMSGLNSLGSNPLFNIGMGLLSAGSHPFGDVGAALMQANQATTSNQMARQDQAMKRLQFQKQMQQQDLMSKLIPQLMGGAAPAQGAPQAPPGIAAPDPTAGAPPPQLPGLGGLMAPPPPQGAVPQGIAAPPPPSAVPTPPMAPSAGSPAGPGMGIDPNAALNLGLVGSMVGMPGAKELMGYPEAYGKVQESQQKLQQLRAQGPLAVFDSAAGSDQAHHLTQSDPSLLANWQKNAAAMGFNPQTDINDPAATRAVARYGYNQIAGQVGLPTKALPTQMQTMKGPLGQVLQKDQEGKISEPVKEEELQQVVGPNGTPVLVPRSQAAGRQPFNASVFGASSMTDQAKELAYQEFTATGKIPQGYARNPMMNASLLDYIAKRANTDGLTGVAAAAKAQTYTAQQGVIKDFTSGKTGQSLTAVNTAVAHMDTLRPLITAMGNGNLTALNKVQNWFKDQTGSPAPGNMSAIKNFVMGEVSKAVLPGGGGEHERDAISAPLAQAKSTPQLLGALDQIQKALAGKTEAMRNQWDVGTNGTQGDFNKFLVPETKRVLGITDAPDAPSRPGQGTSGKPSLADIFK